MSKATNEQCKRFTLLSQKNVKGLLTDPNEIAEWKELKPLCWKDKRCMHPLFENEGTNSEGVKFFFENGRIFAEKNGEDFGTIGQDGSSWEASSKELNDYILKMNDNAFYFLWIYFKGWVLAQN
jgi:hypothetical protein